MEWVCIGMTSGAWGRLSEAIPTLRLLPCFTSPEDATVTKGQKKSNKEIRKPKVDKSKPRGGSPTLKDDSMLGVEKKRR